MRKKKHSYVLEEHTLNECNLYIMFATNELLYMIDGILLKFSLNDFH